MSWTMIERVARAIGVADLNECERSMPNVPLEKLAEYVKKAHDEGHYTAMARAAIGAMREPSTAMVDSGVASALNVTLSGGYRWNDYVADKHRAMIDAALNEQEGA